MMPSRAIIELLDGEVIAKADPEVEWHLIEWEKIREGEDIWTDEEIADLRKWGGSLVTDEIVGGLIHWQKYWAKQLEERGG